MLPYADMSGNVYVPIRAEGGGIIGDGYILMQQLSKLEQAAWKEWLLDNPIDVVEDAVALKHLPGCHAQQTHAPHTAVAGTPVTSEWMNDGGSVLLMDDLKSPETTLERIAVISALVNQGITQGELAGLKGITLQPPEGYELEADGYFRAVDREYAEGEYTAGVYDPTTKTVHLSPAVMYESDSWETVVHEVGHHVSLRSSFETRAGVRVAASEVLRSQLQYRNPTDVELIDYGLRPYSMTNRFEFLADSFLAWKCGSEVQRRNLTKLWGEVWISGSMEEMFKQLGTMVSVWELQARAIGDMIELVATPVVVDESLVKAIPWYYVGVGKTLKHLEGKHDQRSHGRKRGGEAQFKPSVVRDDLDYNYVDKAALDAYIDGVDVTWLRDREFPSIYTEESIKWKANVVHSLSLETGLEEERVNEVVKAWAHTSNDSDPKSLGLQVAASDLFDTGLSDYQRLRLEEWMDSVKEWEELEFPWEDEAFSVGAYTAAKTDGKSILMAMYNKTQQEFKAAGVEKVILYRGVWGPVGHAGDIRTGDANAMESWGLNPNTARRFASEGAVIPGPGGVVYQAEFPVERVLATPKTGFGCMNEYEYIVLGLPEGQMDNVRVVFSTEDIPIE